MSEWCTIESDPAVFTELIQKFGVEGVKVEELFTLEDDAYLHDVKPIYGLIFLFKWSPEQPKSEVQEVFDPELFFSQQTITNSCATQAILSILFNSPEVSLGTNLTELKSFMGPLDPASKGMSIDSSEVIKAAHNSFSRPEPFIYAGKKPATKDDDVFHFVSYVPFNGKLYELDGLQKGPIMLGECTEENWLDLAKPVIAERIQKSAQNEIRFNLMAVCASRKAVAEKKISEIKAKKGFINAKLLSLGADVTMDEEEMADGDPNPEDLASLPDAVEELKGLYAQLSSTGMDYQSEIAEEEAKFRSYAKENARRKHNYIPFILNMLKILSAKGELKPMVEQAIKVKKEKEEAKSKEGAEAN
eukprot:CAMPEP_0114976606 /NCGR_PEP_ID=MMETSP0216-20121206/2765_1 /TAXON_ID=223996 /ORGANISM="Protocruzia adherens, Strain Boccale" /LENGTH=359 /DNA_ID=CAMNT_0002337551 /DNA_START=51 /DNA_END=1130 /DNA_ORIENTATION=+